MSEEAKSGNVSENQDSIESDQNGVLIISRFLDSSILIDYLVLGKFTELVESSPQPFISSISLFEIKKKLLKGKDLDSNQVSSIMSSIRKQVVVIDINWKISESAADLSQEHNLGAADAIIYASAVSNNYELLTLDNDFRGLKGAKVL